MLELEKTKREVERMANRWLSPYLGVWVGTFVLHNVEIPRGYRGIHSFRKGKVTIESTGGDPRSVKIVWETILEEERPANANNDPDILPLNARSESRTDEMRGTYYQRCRAEKWYIGLVSNETTRRLGMAGNGTSDYEYT
jgi:hypothetical protein